MDDGTSCPTDSAGLMPLFAGSPTAEGLEEKLRRVREENRRLAGTLGAILADRPNLRALARASASAIATARAPNGSASNAAREDAAGVTVEPRPKVRTVCARAEPADTDANLSVKDGYQWRKYGQKVTRDNPYPRSYFRCAFTPSCPVKKKVQRDAADTSKLVATYEGEHNHAKSPEREFVGNESTCQAGSRPCSLSINPSGRTIRLEDMTNHGSESRLDLEAVRREVFTPEFQKLLVEKMVNSLKNDADFMHALTNKRPWGRRESRSGGSESRRHGGVSTLITWVTLSLASLVRGLGVGADVGAVAPDLVVWCRFSCSGDEAGG